MTYYFNYSLKFLNYPKQDEKLLSDSDELLSELEALELALHNNLQTKEIYTISQEIAPKIGILTPNQESEFKQLLREFTDLFAKDITQLGRTDLVMHKIYTEDVPLISSRPYSVPITEQAFITKYSTYKFNIMPFGLCNIPATFQ